VSFLEHHSPNIQPKLLGAICASVLVVILVSGLWPFHAPRNDVRWLSPRNGLIFGKHGSVVSAGAFEPNRSGTNSSCSLEIWLEPSRVNSSGAILAFYSQRSAFVPFVISQSRGDLKLEHRSHYQSGKKTTIYACGLRL
jgi:hypothetical protein